MDEEVEDRGGSPQREQWTKGVEFLLSCIAMSVGLGNIWRFPFVAYENGGGAFLIPYIIVLVLVGKPLYFMEMVLGQFSSKGSVKVYDFVPALRGSILAYVVNFLFERLNIIYLLFALFIYLCTLWKNSFD